MAARLMKTGLAAILTVCSVAGITMGTSGQADARPDASSAVSPVGDDQSAVTNRLIVTYKSGARAASVDADAGARVAALAARLRLDAKLVRRLGTGAALVDLGAAADARAIRETRDAFAADPEVAAVEREPVFTSDADPNDTYYPKQWNLAATSAGMNVPAAWPVSTGAGVTVAVIDSGITKHSDLDANSGPGYDFVGDKNRSGDGDGRDSDPTDEGTWFTDGHCGTGHKVGKSGWHGTMVAGIVGAISNNAKGIAGVAPRVSIQSIRVFGSCGAVGGDILDAIIWASGGEVPGVPANTRPAKVISMSLGWGRRCNTSTQNAIDGALSRGTTVVASAGNSNRDATNHSPSGCNGVISVAAGDSKGAKASYSNYGGGVTITAPGSGIWSTTNTSTTTPGAEGYRAASGTSFAAPHIAALAALMLAKNPKLTPSQIQSIMKANARPLPAGCPPGCGAGLADAAKTVAAVPKPPTGTVTVTNPGTLTGFRGWPVSWQIKVTSSDSSPVTFRATGLPAGLTISSSGQINGTPGASGAFTVTVTATNSSGATGKTTFPTQIWGW